jgi:hypothetical protein
LLLSVALLRCASTSARPRERALPAENTATDLPDRTARPIPADLGPGIERAEAIGTALYLQDKASAIATDVLFARVKTPEKRGLGGYLTLREGDASGPKPSWFVLFYTAGDDPRIVYRVHVPMEPGTTAEIEERSPPEAPSDEVRVLIKARQLAIARLPEIRQPINPEILPGSAIGESGILVYLIAGTERSNVAVFGRHYRVLVSADGSQVKKFEPLSNSVLELPLAGSDAPKDKQLVGLSVSHVLSDAPIETHVLVSRQYKLPVYVATKRGDWRVDDGRISFLGDRREP